MKTLGEISLNRSTTACAPWSGETQDQTAPRLADARSPTTAPGQVGRDAPPPAPGLHALLLQVRREGCRLALELAPSDLGLLLVLPRRHQRDVPVVLVP